MNNLFLLLALGILTVSCGNNEQAKEQPEQLSTEEKKEGPSAPGLALMEKSDCSSCHKVNEVAIGPSYEAIAAKYASSEKVIDTLAEKIIAGGAGKWGAIPMTPHPQISKEEAKEMVQYILSLKK